MRQFGQSIFLFLIGTLGVFAQSGILNVHYFYSFEQMNTQVPKQFLAKLEQPFCIESFDQLKFSPKKEYVQDTTIKMHHYRYCFLFNQVGNFTINVSNLSNHNDFNIKVNVSKLNTYWFSQQWVSTLVPYAVIQEAQTLERQGQFDQAIHLYMKYYQSGYYVLNRYISRDYFYIQHYGQAQQFIDLNLQKGNILFAQDLKTYIRLAFLNHDQVTLISNNSLFLKYLAKDDEQDFLKYIQLFQSIHKDKLELKYLRLYSHLYTDPSYEQVYQKYFKLYKEK